jgi:ElaB/YqjD/DUF883 family membrane-anchored ribosome-binding protein
MNTQPEQIRQDIQHTEAELSGDINALTDRVNPQRIAQRKADGIRGAVQSAKEKVMGRAESARDMANAKRGDMTHQAQHAADSMKHTADSMKHTAESAPHMVRERAEGSPLAAGMIAFGAGMLFSSLMPRSQREQQLAGRVKHTAQEHSGQVKERLSDAGQQMTERMREPAQQAMDSVRSSAEDAASRVRDEGQWAGRDVKQQTQQATQNVTR